MERRQAIGEEAIPSQSVRGADRKKPCPNIKPSVLSGNIYGKEDERGEAVRVKNFAILQNYLR